jgi:outer membrane biosynthesis protein TonB
MKKRGPTSSTQGAVEEISERASHSKMAAPSRTSKPIKTRPMAAGRELSALKAKKKMHEIVDLRRKVASISGSQGKSSPKNTVRGTGAGSSQGAATYMDKIVGEIKAGWVYPDWAEKDLLMIINVKIQRDGTIQVLEVEKKSGNPLFDRSVQQAIIASLSLHRPARWRSA